MFDKRPFRTHGNSVRFADKDEGAVTAAYSYSLTRPEREYLARRVTAALNICRHLSTEELEQMAPITVIRESGA